jgi:hypothetical protein
MDSKTATYLVAGGDHGLGYRHLRWRAGAGIAKGEETRCLFLPRPPSGWIGKDTRYRDREFTAS